MSSTHSGAQRSCQDMSFDQPPACGDPPVGSGGVPKCDTTEDIVSIYPSVSAKITHTDGGALIPIVTSTGELEERLRVLGVSDRTVRYITDSSLITMEART